MDHTHITLYLISVQCSTKDEYEETTITTHLENFK